ncbi:MAG: ATP-dependent acyl-CoA ligase [Alcaligenaceae bacterium]|nr:MAG: ATP-dependent acyl-CoA ligase [Alcaligenaceae bacterium]
MATLTRETLQEKLLEHKNIRHLLEGRAQQYGDKTFLIWDGDFISYRQIDEMSNRAANALLGLGLNVGDRVAIMMANSPEWLAIWFGAVKIGAVIVPINTAYKGDGLAYQLADSNASVLAVDGDLVSRLAVLEPAPSIPNIYVGATGEGGHPAIDSSPLVDLFDAPSAPPPAVTLEPHDPATILYTSGTTGVPKGCVLPHGQYLAAAFIHSDNCEYGTDTVIYTCLPLFHINAQNYTILSALSAGATIAMDKRFSASAFWNRLIETGATAFNFIGSMAVSLWNRPPVAAEKQHKARVAFGVPIPLDLWGEWEERFQTRVVYAYGMTENALPAIFPLSETPVPSRLRGTAGKASPAAEVAIVDERDWPVGPGVVGEIVTRPTVPWTMMTEYLGKPEASIEAFHGCWFHTGDLGYLDEDGYLFYVDRKKDALRRKGEMVSSWEVETAVGKFDAVAECAVVGIPSEMGEDEIMIVVVPKEGTCFDPRELLVFCEERIAKFQIPRYVRTVESLPRTQTQRVEKYKLRLEGITPDTWDSRASVASV